MTIPSPPPSRFTLGDFDFVLPPELIAQHPAAERSGSRLLDGTAAAAPRPRFRDLPELLRAGDLLVVNDTRVVKARLLGAKASGGAVEALVERIEPENRVLAQLRASKSPKPGSRLRLGAGAASRPRCWGAAAPTARCSSCAFPSDPLALLERHGHVPLPPYIARDDGAEDERRYQTVFAAQPGAVAAPTAALHFDDDAPGSARRARRRALRHHPARRRRHLPAGAQRGPRRARHAQRALRRRRRRGGGDRADPGARRAGGRGRHDQPARAGIGGAGVGVVAGRRRLAPSSGETRLFITPGFAFRVVDLLLTNFHLPKSTLLMLVSAFAGHERVRALYRHAIAERYRFFSYGDAMLLARGA